MEMFYLHEKEANSILTKSGLKHLVAVTPSIYQSVKRFGSRSGPTSQRLSADDETRKP